MISTLLAVASSALWGTADFAGGMVSRRHRVTTVVLLSQTAGAVAMLIVSLVVRQPFPKLYWLAMLAGISGVVGLVFFYRGLATGKMSLVAPVSACGAVIPVVVSLATGSVPRPITMAGIVCALGGVVLASIRSSDPVVEAEHPRKAAGSAIGAALGFGFFFLLIGRAAALEPHSVTWLSLFTRVGSVPVLALGITVARTGMPWRGLARRDAAIVAFAGLGDAGANTLFAQANTLGSMAVVAVMGSLYPLVTAGLARVRLGERLTTRQKLGAGLAMLGVVLVSLP